MAGMIPGVGLTDRRRIGHYQLVERREEVVHLHNDMDSVTSEARIRLMKRLGYATGSFRRNGRAGVRSNVGVRRAKDTHGRSGFVKELIFGGLRWLKSKNSEQVCAICLDRYYGDEEVMVLKCSHKYHSKCLVAWLEAHSSCPYCRNPV